jgi:NADPH-dependent F420 reductase
VTSRKPVIAILGGTGDLGSGLAYQLARAGYKITIGSRSADKAQRAAQALLEDAPGTCIRAAANPEAAAGAEVVIMTVPFASHDQIIDSVRDSVQGKIFVDRRRRNASEKTYESCLRFRISQPLICGAMI